MNKTDHGTPLWIMKLLDKVVRARFLFLLIIFFLCINSVRAIPLTTGLMSYYNFSNTANDAMGINNLTVTGATYSSTNDVTAIKFTNSGDKAVLTSGVNLPFNISSTGLSICGYVNSTDASATYQRAFLLGNNSNAGNRMGFQIRQDPSPTGFKIWWSTYGVGESEITTNITPGNSGYLCGILNSSGSFAYLNATLISSSLSFKGSPFINSIQAGQDSANTGEQFKGLLARVAIYNRTLSISDMSLLISNNGDPFATGSSFIISSVSPLNNSFTYNSTPTFNFNATSVGNWNVSLFVNGTNYGTNVSYISQANGTIMANATISNGQMFWFFSATDGNTIVNSTSNLINIGAIGGGGNTYVQLGPGCSFLLPLGASVWC